MIFSFEHNCSCLCYITINSAIDSHHDRQHMVNTDGQAGHNQRLRNRLPPVAGVGCMSFSFLGADAGRPMDAQCALKQFSKVFAIRDPVLAFGWFIRL